MSNSASHSHTQTQNLFLLQVVTLNLSFLVFMQTPIQHFIFSDVLKGFDPDTPGITSYCLCKSTQIRILSLSCHVMYVCGGRGPKD